MRLDSIAYVECHNSQAAGSLKFWFDNKYACSCLYAHITTKLLLSSSIATSKAVEQLLRSQTPLRAIPSVHYPKVSLVRHQASVTHVLCLDSEPPPRGAQPQLASVAVGQPSVAPTRANFRGASPGGMGRGMMNGNMTGMGMGNMGMNGTGMGTGMNVGGGIGMGGNPGGGGNFVGRGGFQGGRGGMLPQGQRGGMAGRGGTMGGGGGGMGTNL